MLSAGLNRKMLITDTQDFMPDYVDLLQANRKLGYSTLTAIADICDNPVDAGASNVWVNIDADGDKVKSIIISDDGHGMTEYHLQKALVPASTGRTRNAKNELGFFGVGLVASGLSLGNKIEIYTRGSEGDFYSYIDWNEKVFSNNPVNLIRRCSSEESKNIIDTRIGNSETGTVIWISNINIAHSKYDYLIERLEFHLAVTYYNLRDKYQVHLNNVAIKSWDIIEAGKAHDTSEIFEYPIKREVNGVVIDTTIKLQFSYLKKENPDRASKAYGTQEFNSTGALERNGRLLTYGSWLVNRGKSNPYNGLRFRLSYNDAGLDDVIFDINVQKDDCKIIDQDFYDWLHKHITDYWTKTAKPIFDKYRGESNTDQRKSGKKLPVAQDRLLYLADSKLVQNLKGLNVNKLTYQEALQKLKAFHLMASDIDHNAEETRKLKQTLKSTF